MADCEYLEECPIFERFQNEGVKRFWIDLYCKTEKQEQCARKPLIRAGKPVPDTLLPSGKRWSPLDTVILPRSKEGGADSS